MSVALGIRADWAVDSQEGKQELWGSLFVECKEQDDGIVSD
jgi:hypothetical protein